MILLLIAPLRSLDGILDRPSRLYPFAYHIIGHAVLLRPFLQGFGVPVDGVTGVGGAVVRLRLAGDPPAVPGRVPARHRQPLQGIGVPVAVRHRPLVERLELLPLPAYRDALRTVLGKIVTSGIFTSFVHTSPNFS